MIENFEEYLYKKIGKRIRDFRKEKKLSQLELTEFSEMVGLKTKSASPRLSFIENGKIQSMRDFMSDTERNALANYLTEGDQIKLFFGSDEDLKDLLSMLLYTLLLNGEKPQPTDNISREFVNIEYNRKYEELSNILIKFMLLYPEFNKAFIIHFLYSPIAEHEKNKRNKLLEKENEKIKQLLASNSGNFIKEIVSSVGTSLL